MCQKAKSPEGRRGFGLGGSRGSVRGLFSALYGYPVGDYFGHSVSVLDHSLQMPVEVNAASYDESLLERRELEAWDSDQDRVGELHSASARLALGAIAQKDDG